MPGFTTSRAFLSLCLSLLCWLILGPVLAFGFLRLVPRNSITGYLALHIPYLALFSALAVTSRVLLRMPLSKMLSPGRFRWDLLVSCGAIYLALLLAGSLISHGTLRWSGVTAGFYLARLPLVLVCTPVQTISEEMVFRVYPCRIAYGGRLPSKPLLMLPLSLLSGLLFLLPHLWNIEVASSPKAFLAIAYYFLWGTLAMFLALSTGGFEAPVAMHTVNNLYVALIANYVQSSMPYGALFVDSKPASTGSSLLFALLIFSLLFLFSWRKGYVTWRPDAKKENKETETRAD